MPADPLTATPRPPSAPGAGPPHVGLRFAVAPLVVFVLAQIVFELAGHDLASLAGAQQVGPEPARTDELAARMRWATSVLIFLAVALASLVGAGALLASHVPAAVQRRYVVTFLVLTGGSLVHLVLSSELRSAFSAIYFFTYEQLAACGCMAPAELARYARTEIAVNVLAAVTPMLLLLATCAVLEPDGLDGQPALRVLQDRMRRLKRLLNFASALLVAGMLNMSLWLRWPGALTADGGAASVPVTDAVTFFWGTVFTLVIISLYVPASMRLNRRATALLERYPEAKGSARDTAEWLERHGLSLTPTQQLPQVMAMLAPMLVGSAGSTLAGMPGALFG